MCCTGQVIQRLQDLETVAVNQLDRALSKSSDWDCTVLAKADDVDWTGGGYSCSREVGLAAGWHGPTGAS